MSANAANNPSWDGKDRRASPELREIFERAYALIEPFLDPDSSWGGQAMQHLALRTLRDSFPELSMDQAHILVVAATRVRRERRAAAL
jgi:hypothetical protein